MQIIAFHEKENQGVVGSPVKWSWEKGELNTNLFKTNNNKQNKKFLINSWEWCGS